MERLLPRHLLLIYDINFYFLEMVKKKWPGDVEKLRTMSIIEEGNPRMVPIFMYSCNSLGSYG